MRGSDKEIQALVNVFWGKRDESVKKHSESGVQGAQARSGTHMSAIQDYVRQLFVQAGLSDSDILKGSPFLPGYFRRSKSWDVVAIYKGHLVGAVELKSQVGSVGKNSNNRIEEAIGNAFDLVTVHKNRKPFGVEIPPWLGFVMVLEETDKTEASIKKMKTVFPSDDEFENISYSGQYRIALSRFVSEKLYDAGWFLTTRRETDSSFSYKEPLQTATASTLANLIKSRVDFVKQVVDAL